MECKWFYIKKHPDSGNRSSDILIYVGVNAVHFNFAVAEPLVSDKSSYNFMTESFSELVISIGIENFFQPQFQKFVMSNVLLLLSFF